jgi:S-adenosylmethionine/arginine decarboxylase-like enzyme
LDVFSCAWFDPDEVIAFILDFFGASIAEQRLMQRG